MDGVTPAHDRKVHQNAPMRTFIYYTKVTQSGGAIAYVFVLIGVH